MIKKRITQTDKEQKEAQERTWKMNLCFLFVVFPLNIGFYYA